MRSQHLARRAERHTTRITALSSGAIRGKSGPTMCVGNETPKPSLSSPTLWCCTSENGLAYPLHCWLPGSGQRLVSLTKQRKHAMTKLNSPETEIFVVEITRSTILNLVWMRGGEGGLITDEFSGFDFEQSTFTVWLVACDSQYVILRGPLLVMWCGGSRQGCGLGHFKAGGACQLEGSI